MNKEDLKQYLRKDIVLRLVDGISVEGKVTGLDSKKLYVVDVESEKVLPVEIGKIKDVKRKEA